MPKAIAARRPQIARTEQIIEVPDLTGGVNLRVAQTLLEPTEARLLRNFDVSVPGALTVRAGFTLFSSGSLGSGRAQGGQRVYLSSHTFTLVAHGGEVYRVSDASTASVVFSTVHATNQVFFPYDRDIVAIFDGSTNRAQKSTNGSSWTNFGLSAPSTCVTASTLSTGACSSGEYEFAFSFKDRELGYESNISSGSTITLTDSTGAFHLEAGSSLGNDPQADAYVWYGRDISAGESVFRKISSGTASTFRVTDTNWTANDEAPTNHDVLTNAKFGTPWKNRWWLVDAEVGNRLHFSELFLPQAFPALFYIDIPFERGDSIAAIVPLGDVLVIFGQSKKAFLLIGQTSLDFEVRPSAGTQAGALGPRAVEVIEQGIVHAAAEGVFIFDGASDRLLSNKIEPAWRDYVTNASAADLEKTPVVYESRRKCLRVGVTRLYPTAAAGEWELNLQRSRNDEAWTATDRSVGGYIHFDGNEATPGLRGELLSWHSSVGTLWKESTGVTANSSNMTAVYEGPTLSMGLYHARVHSLFVEYEPHGGNFTTETYTDEQAQGGIALPIGTGLALIGTALVGTATIGGTGRRHAHTPQPLGADGHTVQLKCSYTGQEAFRLFQYAYAVMPETRPRGFSD